MSYSDYLLPITTGIAITLFILRLKDRQVKVHVEKVKEPEHRIRKIRVRYVNKPIERCNVSFKGTKLIWDGTDGQFEYTIFEGVQKNATIPDDIFTEDVEVIIRTKNHILKRVNFKDLEIGQ